MTVGRNCHVARDDYANENSWSKETTECSDNDADDNWNDDGNKKNPNKKNYIAIVLDIENFLFQKHWFRPFFAKIFQLEIFRCSSSVQEALDRHFGPT